MEPPRLHPARPSALHAGLPGTCPCQNRFLLCSVKFFNFIFHFAPLPSTSFPHSTPHSTPPTPRFCSMTSSRRCGLRPTTAIAWATSPPSSRSTTNTTRHITPLPHFRPSCWISRFAHQKSLLNRLIRFLGCVCVCVYFIPVFQCVCCRTDARASWFCLCGA